MTAAPRGRRGIDRLSGLDRERFFEEHVRARIPVILTDLFAGEPLRAIRTSADAVRQIGSLELDIQEEYALAFLRSSAGGPRLPRRRYSIAEYLSYVALKPATRLLCTEQDTPPAVTSLFTFPSLCSGGDGVVSKIFVAAAGNAAHLHFDGDQRHVLLYQVFGRKRVHLIDTEETWKLQPVANFSGLFVERFAPEDREALLDYVRAYDCVLDPGDALFIPMMMWHQVSYLDTAMSVSLRFARGDIGRFLAERFHYDHHLQSLAVWLSVEPEASPLRVEIVAALFEADARSFASPDAKYAHMKELFRRLSARIGGAADAYVLPATDPLGDAITLRSIRERELYAAAAVP